MVGPIDAPAAVPDALVLVASPSLGGALRRVREGGWAGPVVVVGDMAQARELAGTRRPAPAPSSTPVRAPGQPTRSRQPRQARLMLDPDRRVVVSGGREAALTPLEHDLLHALLVEPGRVRAFAELTEQVWGTPYDGDAGQVHSAVKRLRRKLDAIASPLQVQAVRGVGFRAIARVLPPRAR